MKRIFCEKGVFVIFTEAIGSQKSSFLLRLPPFHAILKNRQMQLCRTEIQRGCLYAYLG